MAKIEVAPLPDGVAMKQNWQVKKNGGRISNHNKKSAALRKGKKTANKGDTLVIYRVNGTVQERRTVRAGTGHSSSGTSKKKRSAGTPYGVETFEKGIGDAFDF